MSDLEKFKNWLISSGMIPDKFQIDYTSKVPGNVGLFPGGLVEIRRRENILDEVTVTNQYNFALYCVMPFDEGNDDVQDENAEWVIRLQQWVQEQGIRKQAPTFGNVDTGKEVIRAQNGALYASEVEGTALYMMLLSVEFKLFYGGNS